MRTKRKRKNSRDSNKRKTDNTTKLMSRVVERELPWLQSPTFYMFKILQPHSVAPVSAHMIRFSSQPSRSLTFRCFQLQIFTFGFLVLYSCDSFEYC
ncbi:hypothetical protein BS17DRAFT_361579 [Gyrodon lividus]|nr:hypothetical protein BS17DRAFT_361579 [Gyrodon lividus]